MTNCSKCSGEAVLWMLSPTELVHASVGHTFIVGLFRSRSRATVVMDDRRWNISIAAEKDLVVAYLYDS